MSPQNTIWPHTISPSKRSLVLKLFSLLDSSSADSGPRLANEIFTPDGRIKNGTQSFTGRAEISTSRQTAWTAWSSRKHTILRVYSRDHQTLESEKDDILFIGELAATFPNGESATGEFCARVVFAAGQEGEDGGEGVEGVRIRLYEVWADSTPFVTAMSKKV